MGSKFNADSRAKTRCYVINNSNQSKLKFQFNPESLQYSRSVNYATIESPGMAYPLTQFVNGSVREFSVELFYYDKPCSGKIAKARNFLHALLPPEKNSSSFTKPPTFKFACGYFVKNCVLTDLNVHDEWFDRNGNAIMTRFTLTIRQVGA